MGISEWRSIFGKDLSEVSWKYARNFFKNSFNVGSPEHRLQGVILDISSNRLFKAVRVCDSIEKKNRPFLKIKFANKGIDALNLIIS